MEDLRDRARDPAKRAEREAELWCPAFPMAAWYLWQAYHRIRRRKGSAGFGPSPIEWPDIDAFIRRSKVNLAPWEILVIEEIDDLYIAEQAKRMDKGGTKPQTNES